MTTHHRLLALAFAGCLLAAPQAAAFAAGDGAEKAPESPGQMLDDATRRMLNLLETFIESIPMYELPEVLPNGDIIIRRKNPKDDGTPEETPEEPDTTQT